jgi:hypothetical protein
VQNLLLHFSTKTHKKNIIIAIYKPPQMQTNNFISILETTLKKIPTNCPTIIVGDFNIDMLIDTPSINNITKLH